ncbi:hypothetical protein MMC20_001010 [Loxospora ochrophaea]|nr:hypothetical protein [Loxospora ochrophaea]
MATTDFRGPDSYPLPHRKPVPMHHGMEADLRPLTKIVPDSQLGASGLHQGPVMSHSRTRTSSSSIFPQAPPASQPSQPPSSYPNAVNNNRRTASSATNASSNAWGASTPARTSSTNSSTLRRSTSTRSGASITPTSYVALMRKQKATVWCDRAQHDDPRLLAQQKAAKNRAAMEVMGGNKQGRSSTSGSLGSGGVRSKIRHHGAPKAVGYTPANYVGGGVPMRLSASEVGDEGNNDDDADSQYQQRTGSGRSSLASNQRLAAFNQRPPGRLSQGSTPPSGQGSSPGEDISELAEETPVPGHHQRHDGDYFFQAPGKSGSGSSSEMESSFGNVGGLDAPSNSRRDDGGKNSDELRRRGSVDERAPTMTGAVRLFVANPDLSD